MFAELGLLNQLQQHASNNIPLCIYGDPAHSLSVHFQAPFRGANLTQGQKRFNTAMSSV